MLAWLSVCWSCDQQSKGVFFEMYIFPYYATKFLKMYITTLEKSLKRPWIPMSTKEWQLCSKVLVTSWYCRMLCIYYSCIILMHSFVRALSGYRHLSAFISCFSWFFLFTFHCIASTPILSIISKQFWQPVSKLLCN